MGVIYNGAHAITFTKLRDNTTKNSWRDLSLIPSSKPYIQPPKPQFDYTPLARSKEIIDLSMALRKTFGFESTQGQWEFYIDHEDWKWTNWTQEYWELEDFFDGTMFTVKLDDPYDDNIYTGTISMASYKPGEDFSTIILAYNINWLLDADMMPDWYGSPYPKYLEIYQNPDKMTYEDEEEIDYTGLIVRLLSPTKDVYTDAGHPDGIIPNEELIFDKTTASWSDNQNGVLISWNSTYKQETLSTYLKIHVNVPPYATKISVIECPIPGQVIGDPVNLDGSIIKAYKIDGSLYEDPNYLESIVPISEISFTPNTIDSDDSMQTITLSWIEPMRNKTLTCKLKVKVYESELYCIKITTLPRKLSYTASEDLNLGGIVVKRVKINYLDYTDEYYPDATIPRNELLITEGVEHTGSGFDKNGIKYTGELTDKNEYISGKVSPQSIQIFWRSNYYNDYNQYFTTNFTVDVTGPVVRSPILYGPTDNGTSAYCRDPVEIVEEDGVTKLSYISKKFNCVEDKYKYISEDEYSSTHRVYMEPEHYKIVSDYFYYPNGDFSNVSYRNDFNLSISWGSPNYNNMIERNIYCKAALLNKSNNKYIKDVFVKIGVLSSHAYTPVSVSIQNKTRVYDGVLDFLYYDSNDEHTSSDGILNIYFEGTINSTATPAQGFYTLIRRLP